MRALVQRVRNASVSVWGSNIAGIGNGLLVLAGVGMEDTAEDCDWLAQKIVRLRVFADEAGVMNHSVLDKNGEILAVSQFTLYASTRKGNRPSYSAAAPPDKAQIHFASFVAALAAGLRRPVPTGVFGAHMEIALVNDGPVTIWLDTRDRE